jgi:predicted O-methyltransferase YrrM
MPNLFTWQNIPGWFDFLDIYDAAIARASNGAKFVECGTYLGRSTVYMGTQIAASGKSISFDGIDNFSFNITPPQTQTFIDNSPAAGHVNLVVNDQLTQAANYADVSLDFVFLDSDHTYDGTRNAILAFLPKIKSGGVIGGHDCEIRGNFPDVIRAVRDTLPGFSLDRRSFLYVVP